MIEPTLDYLRSKIEPLERFTSAYSRLIDNPRYVQKHQGFRFLTPDYRHFLLLRCTKTVSALNACLALAKAGYANEIPVLLRTTIEFQTQIQFVVVSLDSSGQITDKEVASFIRDYFLDDTRPRPPNVKPAKLRQDQVHEKLGAKLDSFVRSVDQRTSKDRYSNIYFVFSNYVHGRYPETIDSFGGTPGRFHMTGMSGTPKDLESVVTIDTFIDTIALCFAGMAQKLGTKAIFKDDETLANWYKAILGL